MIKLKISSREMQAISRYLQISIDIAREEISNGMDICVKKFSDSCMVKYVQWDIQDRAEHMLRISFRNAHIDEFERMQKKFILAYDHKNQHKKKVISITKSSGHFFLLYLPKVEHAAKMFTDNLNGMDYVNFTASAQAGVIFKNMI